MDARHGQAQSPMTESASRSFRSRSGIRCRSRKNAVGHRRVAWGISTNVEQKERIEVHEQQAADARKYAAKVCDGILTLIDENLIPSVRRRAERVLLQDRRPCFHSELP